MSPPSPSQARLLPDESPDPVAQALAAAQPGSAGHFNELFGRLTEPAGPRAGMAPLWQRFFRANGAEGWQDLTHRAALVQRRVQEDGATYNVYNDGVHASRPWPLELLPMLVGAEEWAVVERGV